MGSSVTPFPPGDPPLRGARPATLSPGLLLALKVVLGIAGIAGCALLGAGGALLIKHWLTPASHAVVPAMVVTPATRARSEAEAATASASASTLSIVPTAPAEAVVAAPDASGASASLPASAIPVKRDVVATRAPSRPGRLGQPPLPSRIDGPPRHDAHPEGGTTSTAADKASCLAAVNAITADLSLRNEPPTPQQLAILKRGCK